MSSVYVGNDIVDLEQPRTEGRATDERFVGRVYDADEQAAIRESDDPDLEVWTRWAAKEAAFKVISKVLGAPPPFVHRAFKVEWTSTADARHGHAGDRHAGEGDVVRRGRVGYRGHEARVSVALCPGSVHAVGYASAGEPPDDVPLRPRVALLDEPESVWAGPLAELERRFTEAELDAVYSRHSAAVRLGARAHLAHAMQVEEGRLEIVCDPGPTSQRPPRVLLDGERAPADVSLSHDGRWLAWVLWLDPDVEADTR